MTLLAIWVGLVLLISASCSLSEAALYAVRVAYVRQLKEAGKRAGQRLAHFKANMEQPITAILILNTAANTAGAAFAGAQARIVLGPESLLVFSALFTLAVLVLAEVIPKVTGVAYNRAVAPVISAPVRVLILALYPLVWFSTHLARLIKGGGTIRVAPEDEVRQFAALSAEEGSILPVEAALVKNVLRLNDIRADGIMTPRSVVFKLASDVTVGDLAAEAGQFSVSRVPVYDTENPDRWLGVVLRRDILARLLAGEVATTVGAISQRLHLIPADMPGHELLHLFVQRRAHLFGVVDQFDNIEGIVTLEDVLESLIGQEIVDETDAVVDTREEARRLRKNREQRNDE